MRRSLFAGTVLAALFVAAVLFTNCQSLSSVFREPVLSLHSVELVNINFTGVQLLCKVNVENPNSLDIPFPETDWEFFVNANSFVKGTIKNGQSLRPRRTTVVDVPVSFEYLEVFNTFSSLKGANQADYKVALDMKFVLPILGDMVFNFQHEGVFPVLQLPKLDLPSMKVDKLDFTRAEVLFTVNVENPNPFDLPSPQMAYDYLVNRNSVIKSSVETAAAIAAASVTPVNIRMTVNYADLYRNFQSLISLGEAPSLFSMRSDFPIPAFADDTFLTEVTGSLPLLKAPTLSFAGIRARNVSLAAIDFDVIWEVENNNSFAMNVRDLSYNLTVNNSQWSSGRVPGAPQIAPNRKTQIPLTITINSLSMVRDLTEIITKGSSAAYSCGGNISLGAALSGLDDFNAPFNFTGSTTLR
jgi:LEA14-like dessication related protein